MSNEKPIIIFHNNTSWPLECLWGKKGSGASLPLVPEFMEFHGDTTHGTFHTAVDKGQTAIYRLSNVDGIPLDYFYIIQFWNANGFTPVESDHCWYNGPHLETEDKIQNGYIYEITVSGTTDKKVEGIWYEPILTWTVTKRKITDDIYNGFGRAVYGQAYYILTHIDNSSLFPTITIPSYTAWDKFWKTKAYKNYLAAVEAKKKQDSEKAAYDAQYTQKCSTIQNIISTLGLQILAVEAYKR